MPLLDGEPDVGKHYFIREENTFAYEERSAYTDYNDIADAYLLHNPDDAGNVYVVEEYIIIGGQNDLPMAYSDQQRDRTIELLKEHTSKKIASW